MRKTGLALALAALGAVAVGCDSDSTNGGGGAGGNAGGAAGGAGGGATGGAGGAAVCPSTYGLSDGTFTATITSVTGVTDGCALQIADAVGATVPVKYDRATNTLSVGKGVGAEALPSLGSGMPSCPGTKPLTRSNQVTDDIASSCYYTDTVTSQFTLAGVDTFTLDVTETESAFTAGCATTTSCTSTYTLSLARVAAGGAGGAGGAKAAAGGAGGSK